jgi:signal transduction histidine kinase
MTERPVTLESPGGPRQRQSARRTWSWLVVIFAIAVAYLLAAVAYVRHLTHGELDHAATHLATVADLKTERVGTWYQDRVADGSALAASPIASTVVSFVSQADPAARHSLIAQLERAARSDHYSAWMLLGAGGRTLLAEPPEATPGQATMDTVIEALASGQVLLSAIHRPVPDGPLALDVVVPFRGVEATGVVILRIDPERDLFLILQDRSPEHQSTETLLVRRERDTVLFIAGTRLSGHRPLDFRVPLAEAGELVAARAVGGFEGTTRGVDYQSTRILAAIRKVPDTPWSIIVKTAESDIIGPARRRATAEVAIVGLLLLAVAGAVSAVAHRRLLVATQHELELIHRLAEADRMEGLANLSGGLAHDLNNVLAAISNVVSTHRQTAPKPDPCSKSFDTIAAACARGRSVVNSLLYFSKDRPGSLGAVRLNDVAGNVARLLDPAILKHASLSVSLEPRLPPITGDESAITQAVMNLCFNSLDATPRGGRITIRTRRTDGGGVELSVIDNGAGMTPEVRARAMEPFFTTKPQGTGAGLGLAMVYATVTAHGGALDIRSAAGEGTEVTMRFPPTAMSAVKKVEPATPDPAPAHRPGTVLLVDDDELILETFVPLLEALGHEVTAASGGLSAIDRLERGLEPGLVILDMTMPDMPGDEVLPRILRLRPSQRVLICTGYTDVDLTPLFALSPFVSSIRKPFTAEELQRAMAELASRA